MSIFDLTKLDDETLYALGRVIGDTAKDRPDVTHQILLGVRDGLNEVDSSFYYRSSTVLEELRRRWRWVLGRGDASPPIPFALARSPSGTGKI